ncbi:DUF1289 domain-containing protein [Actibacterium sp. 188UL27-1]|uniref:DUF1289 domain-containing protein n=1 Tax=Actibacterium sp. 188UL27-1 TaxID=2786961 RepID=UPI00195E4B07|nr:DUF1289 domain-containing protein [Actibacterium sp. 188UL27-1]MBM7066576.1 DUF1289 domain-containing protein [Actibacterium sp. 188UL27-1]
MSDKNDGVPVWTRDEIESPCIKVCVIHPAERICTGCLRTMDEIGAWSRMTPEARRAIMDELPSRAPRLQKRRGGRKARVS